MVITLVVRDFTCKAKVDPVGKNAYDVVSNTYDISKAEFRLACSTMT